MNDFPVFNIQHAQKVIDILADLSLERMTPFTQQSSSDNSLDYSDDLSSDSSDLSDNNLPIKPG